MEQTRIRDNQQIVRFISKPGLESGQLEQFQLTWIGDQNKSWNLLKPHFSHLIPRGKLISMPLRGVAHAAHCFSQCHWSQVFKKSQQVGPKLELRHHSPLIVPTNRPRPMYFPFSSINSDFLFSHFVFLLVSVRRHIWQGSGITPKGTQVPETKPRPATCKGSVLPPCHLSGTSVQF